MIDKSVPSLEEAIAGIPDGATIMIGGFGTAGQPTRLIDALIDQGPGISLSSTTMRVTAKWGLQRC